MKLGGGTIWWLLPRARESRTRCRSPGRRSGASFNPLRLPKLQLVRSASIDMLQLGSDIMKFCSVCEASVCVYTFPLNWFKIKIEDEIGIVFVHAENLSRCVWIGINMLELNLWFLEIDRSLLLYGAS